MTVDAKKAQGVLGFTDKIGEIKLSDCSIKMNHDFSSVLIVPLDDKPISESKEMLVQVGLHARPYGWRDEPAQIKVGRGKEKKEVSGKKIISLGEGVYNIPLINGSITFKKPIKSAVALDTNGYPKKDAKAEIKGKTVILPKNSLYTILKRD